MNKTSYIFLAVGNNISIHNQARLAIFSLFAYLPHGSEIFIITDFPEYYINFKDSINVIHVTAEQLDDWKGEGNYFFRIKIEAILHVASKITGNLVYLDADTVCMKNLLDFEQRLNQGDFFMHAKEFPLCSGPTKTTRQMWRVGKGKSFGSLQIDENSIMWNSGVIAIPAGFSDYLQIALESCDAMCQSKMRPYFVEQLVVGLALTKSKKLYEAKEWFLHYWGNKNEWHEIIIEPFLLETQHLSLAETVLLFKEIKYFPSAIRSKKPDLLKKIKRLFHA